MEILPALIERFRTALATRPANDVSLTIADVYLRLIPYRTVRAELEVLEFAAYEHGLLRLLAGEGDFVEVRDARAREEIQRELASVNPLLGIYRDYADAEVVVVGGAAVPAPPPEPVEPLVEPSAELPAEPSDPAELPAEPSPSSASCRSCGELLPEIEGIRFCPYCGEEQGPVPCRQCGTSLLGEWSFCIRCGTPRA